MSWIEKIQSDLIITTGDGKEYTPAYLNANKAVEYNVKEFEFNDIPGTLVDRRLPKGAKFTLELYFQGEDHLEVAAEFEKSAADKRAWNMSHPLYGDVLVQPMGLGLDNGGYNVTKVSCTVAETIGTAQIRPVVNAPDKIAADKITTDNAAATSFANDVPAKKVSVLQQLTDNVNACYNMVSSQIKESTDASEFFNKYNEVNALINAVVYDAYAIATQVQQLISMPANFADTVANRLKMFENQFALFQDLIPDIEDRAIKKTFEFTVLSVVSGMVLATVTNILTAYTSRKDVIAVIDRVLDVYNAYIVALDTLQDDNGGDPLNYIADATGIIKLNALVAYAVTNLQAVAQDSKQERTIILEEDSNAITLTNRFYGMDDLDENLTYFINTNNLKLSEYLQILKGREIIYYI